MKSTTTWKLSTAILAIVVLFSFSVRQLPASGITAGNLVVVQLGDGVTSANTGNATIGNLKEFTTAGAAVQTIPLPTAAAGSNNRLLNSGSATSEAFLTLSTDKSFLTMMGYDAAAGTAGITTNAPDVTPRVLGKIDIATGNVDSSVKFSTSATPGPADNFNGSNARSAAATDASNIWLAGNAGSGQGATGGVRYVTGATSSTRVDTTASNMRVVNIFNNQLYTSSSTGTLLGISTVGTGLPTTGSSAAITGLPGFPTTGTHSAYDFVFKDANTLYVADDGSAANGGGIQKWTFDGTTWTLAYTLLNTGAATTSVRGLAGFTDGSGNEVLFATTNATTANTLITVTDTGAGATATVLATAPALTVFRGVEYIAAVPEPSTFVLAGLAAVGLIGFSRRRKAC